MVDIHNHSVYSIDDGSASVDESLAMLEMAEEEGICAIVLTPHSESFAYRSRGLEGYYLKVERLRALAEEYLVGVELYTGMEIRCTGHGNILEQLNDGRLITLNDTAYPLIEFSFDEMYSDVARAVNKLAGAGYTPIIAHPERYHCIQEDAARAYALVKAGALLQLDKDSLLGNLGFEALECSVELLEHRLVHAVATDAHRCQARGRWSYGEYGNVAKTPRLARTAEILESVMGAGAAKLLLEDNPARIIDNQSITTDGAIPFD